MTWKEQLNGALKRTTGYQLQRAGTTAAKPTAKRPRVGTVARG